MMRPKDTELAEAIQKIDMALDSERLLMSLKGAVKCMKDFGIEYPSAEELIKKIESKKQ